MTTDKTETTADRTATKATKKAAKKAPAKKSAKPAATKKQAVSKDVKTTKKASTPRAESKGARIIEMLGKAKGATLAELMEATGWQAHSVRGFLSTAAKKQALKIESTKTESGVRTYRIAK